METATFDTDPMLKLLTEALRRGPGSPEWHRAVTSLRDVGSPEADEYQLLMTARERIESGRAYREVRAGPGFTRELFGQLDSNATSSSRKLTLGMVIQLVCLLVLVAAIGVVIMLVAQARPQEADGLSNRLFVTPVQSWTFATMPNDLHVAGQLPLAANGNGLRPAGRDTTEPTGGLVYSEQPLNLTHGTCVEMRLDYKPGPTTVALSLIQDTVTRGLQAEVGTELSLVCDSNGIHLQSPAAATPPRPLVGGSHLLRIKVAGTAAVAEVDGQTIWSGTQSLGNQAFVAARFVRDGRAGDVAVQSLRVLAP